MFKKLKSGNKEKNFLNCSFSLVSTLSFLNFPFRYLGIKWKYNKQTGFTEMCRSNKEGRFLWNKEYNIAIPFEDQECSLPNNVSQLELTLIGSNKEQINENQTNQSTIQIDLIPLITNSLVNPVVGIWRMELLKNQKTRKKRRRRKRKRNGKKKQRRKKQGEK
ncbi:hypothetical protein M0812_10268 [Anaeramoeba flamelloides]|uniref:Uncharacterized protein n=1 Tax=Anaeramoeba flamelloides TaxID=1746091 RepID=A0AAV7ZWV7_9EUKA|nr:hypothetical protein M0812_10268 [Anaeramoeba flamelloides]